MAKKRIVTALKTNMRHVWLALSPVLNLVGISDYAILSTEL